MRSFPQVDMSLSHISAFQWQPLLLGYMIVTGVTDRHLNLPEALDLTHRVQEPSGIHASASGFWLLHPCLMFRFLACGALLCSDPRRTLQPS